MIALPPPGGPPALAEAEVRALQNDIPVVMQFEFKRWMSFVLHHDVRAQDPGGHHSLSQPKVETGPRCLRACRPDPECAHLLQARTPVHMPPCTSMEGGHLHCHMLGRNVKQAYAGGPRTEAGVWSARNKGRPG